MQASISKNINRITKALAVQIDLPEYKVDAIGPNATLEGDTESTTLNMVNTALIKDTPNDKIIFTIDIETEGKYNLDVNYGLPDSFGDKKQFIVVNGANFGSILFENTDGKISTKFIGNFFLEKGLNTVEIVPDFGFMHVANIYLKATKLGAPVEATCPGVPAGQQGFFTANGKLWDATCKEFVFRGVNLQYGDRLSFDAANVKAAIGSIRSVGKANSIRLLIRYDSSDPQGVTSNQDVYDGINLSVANDMVPVLVMYSTAATCGTDLSDLEKATNRWVDLAKPENGSLHNDDAFKKYGIINITNEFGDTEKVTIDGVEQEVFTPSFKNWKDAYKAEILKIRNAGYTNPIMIDTHKCGQNINAFTGSDDGSTTRAEELVNQDPLKNVIFSLHAYNFLWNTDEAIIQNINKMSSSGLTWVFGEHGSSNFEGPSNAVNHKLLWKLCEESTPKIGWLSWAWGSGNGGTAVALNMSNKWDPSNFNELLDYGKEVVSDPFGIENTAVTATVLDEGTLSLPSIFATKAQPISYSNPVGNIMKIQSNVKNKNYSFDIYDMYGKLLITEKSNSHNEMNIDLSYLQSGSYILRALKEGVLISNEIIVKN